MGKRKQIDFGALVRVPVALGVALVPTNPNCCSENDASETQCSKCKGPLDKEAFAKIFNQNIDEKISNQLELVKKDFMIKILSMQNQGENH